MSCRPEEVTMCSECAGKAVVRSAEEGEAFWYDGGLMTMKARPDDTGGSVSVIDVILPPGKATPLHAHPHAEESFYLVDGDIVLHVDGTDHQLAKGATYTIRRGTPHAFAVASSGAHLVVSFTPGGDEQFFVEAGEPAPRRELPPPTEPDLEKYRKAAERTGLILLGPPPFNMATL
jgi:quercetin dioxygenase-like cupin family protein